MGKKLSEMSLEELWHLFPILLTEHQACWNNWYAEEAANLKQILPQAEKIYHIGSTAIPSIWAKPIIDILAEVPRECDLPEIKALLTNSGYICMSQSPDRVSLNKGYTENGFAQRVFHLHLRCAGDHDELYFRDYLLENPEAAKEYEALKLKLWDEYRYNRDGYTEAKADFVAACTLKAKQLYRNRYEMAAQPPTSS
ncbi:MAG: GrpB family protein [Oscillospiraceae bacterium]|nr:GrpB family protein [Oscillospiraceae bacterium]